MSRFFGQINVMSDKVVFEPQGIGNSFNIERATRICHEANEITVVTARILPPWMNSGVVLVDQVSSLTGVALLSIWQRNAFVSEAKLAGFDVGTYKTWSSAGGSIGSLSELVRFRRSHFVS
jgi:hypothetical protein